MQFRGGPRLFGEAPEGFPWDIQTRTGRQMIQNGPPTHGLANTSISTGSSIGGSTLATGSVMGSRFLNQPPTDTSNSITLNTDPSSGSAATSPEGTKQKRDPSTPNYAEKFASLRKADEGTPWPSNEELKREVLRSKRPKN